VIAEGVVAPRRFWDLLQSLACSSEWLRATFALASRPTCYGVVRADGELPVAGFCGTWQSAPRLTLLVADRSISEGALEAAARSCLFAAGSRCRDDPFPLWQPGDPWLSVFSEGEC
jgi:hypothetical protein